MRPGIGLARQNGVARLAVALALLLTGSAGAVLADPDAGQDAPGGQTDAVSADRISDGLKRPELQLPPMPLPPPTFRSEVIEKLETPLDVVRRELQEEANVRWRPPRTQGLDLMPALVGLVNKIKQIRRANAEADARRMVQEELAAFCAIHDCTDIEREPVSEGVIR